MKHEEREETRHIGRRELLKRGSGIAYVLAIGRLLVPAYKDSLRASPLMAADEDSDHTLLQAALDRGGVVQLNRSYVISAPLIVRGGVRIVGNDGARILWRGSLAQPILCDSSLIDPTEINRNIILENFEIDGGGGSDARQIGIHFYRTGKVTIRNLHVHGVGGSGIRWGNSMADTTDILIERCHVYDCREGDAIQGSGSRIIIRDNLIGQEISARRIGTSRGFGDTGIALLADFEARTNPANRHPTDVEISGNRIVGDQSIPKAVCGRSADSPQTGIALGPFSVDHVASVKISGNQIRRCHVNVWIAVMRGVTLTDNELGRHSSSLTGNVRLDGVSDLRIERNRIALYEPGRDRGQDHAAILLNAQRNVFGASTYDANVVNFVIANNLITGIGVAESEGIRLTFGQSNLNPRYISQMHSGSINGNQFTDIVKPIVFASQYGENPGVCSDIMVRNNVIDENAETVAFMSGKPSQYRRIVISNNIAPTKLPLRTGTGAS